ncbi:MAG TPA: NADPH:quinone oxidoreductase family protein [Quisquiliibacterium sp.]|nr:NADPH:quinone oxidoreductase family protein [Quisquiliibacterium sp.]
MRAVLCEHYCDPKDLVIRDIPAPAPGEGQVAIDVEAAGLGYADALNVRGGYQLKRPLPFVPGSEVAGRVAAVGAGVDAALVGRRVMALSNGALAERVVASALQTVVLPDNVPSESAAGCLVTYCTALYGLETCGQLRAGETMLVLGAAGGVGLAAIDVARALGVRVIAAASSAEKIALAVKHGAEFGVDYSQAEWRKALTARNEGHTIDAVYDPVGGPYAETALRCLAPGGRFLVIGFATGEIPRIPLNLTLLKRCSIVGVDWGGHMRAAPGNNRPILERLVSLLASGRLTPTATSVHALDEAPEMLQRLMDRRSLGKPVVRIA